MNTNTEATTPNESFNTQDSRQAESTSGYSDAPSIYDIQKNAETSMSRKLFSRYLTTGNYDRSIKMYELVGMPIFRKLVMKTAGLINKGNDFNYHVSKDKSKLEASTDFAYKGSVFNEAVHAPVGLYEAAYATFNATNENGFDVTTGFHSGLAALNLALVGLQRYNRARMLRTIDEELKNGAHYDDYYDNKFGINAIAEANYYDK